ncbi:MAG: glycosyltransferase family 4 protein [Ignavibacteriaceae bacterium]
MKVIMVDSLTGNDYSTCLCDKLYDLGVDVRLVVPENKEFNGTEKFTINYLSPSKIKDKTKLRKSFEFIRYFIDLYRYIAKNKPDVVHYQFFRRNSGILFYKFLKIKRINLVHTAHNVLPHENSKLDYFLKSIVYKNSGTIIVHSDFIKKKLLKSFPLDIKKIKIVPHGNFDIYVPKEKMDDVKSRLSFNLKSIDNVILFFGFIREYKGLDTLLDAFELSADMDHNLKLLIAGFATKRNEDFYSNKINQSKFKDRILFHPKFIPKADISRYFAASDAVILPYKKIDHSGIIHLAYSFGKPVIATNVGDFSETIEHKKSGILLKGNGAIELAEKINEAFVNKKNLIKMGEYAKGLSETKYSWRDIAKKTASIYKEMS